MHNRQHGYPEKHTYIRSKNVFIYCSSRGNHTPDSSQLCLAVAQAKHCSSFQLVNMPRGNHSQSIASNGGQTEDKKLLQHSPLHQHGEF